jgi:hypothetical protein
MFLFRRSEGAKRSLALDAFRDSGSTLSTDGRTLAVSGSGAVLPSEQPWLEEPRDQTPFSSAAPSA